MVNITPPERNGLPNIELSEKKDQSADPSGSIWGGLKSFAGGVFSAFSDFVNPEIDDESLEGRVSYQSDGNGLPAQQKVSKAAAEAGPFGDVTLDDWPDEASINERERIDDEESFVDDERLSENSDLDEELDFFDSESSDGVSENSADEGSIEDDGLVYFDTPEDEGNPAGAASLHRSSSVDSTSTESSSSTHSLQEASSPDSVLRAEVQKILADGKNEAEGAAVSSQQILSKMVGKLKNLGYQDLSLAAELAGEGREDKYELEAYTMDSAPGKVFYQIKVNYRLVADSPPAGGEWEEFRFQRTIYTTATNPEDAIRLAMQFKGMVHDYAMKDKIETEFDQAALASRSFTFNFSRNGIGAMTHLASIQAHIGTGVNQKNVERKETPPASSTKLFFSPTAGKEWDSSWGKTPLPSYLPFETQQQLAIFKRGFTIKQDYLELTKQRDLKKAASELKQEIKKNQERFDQLAVRYVKTPQMLNLFGTDQEASFSDQVESILKVTEDEDFDPEKLDVNQKELLSSLVEAMTQLYRIHQELCAKQGQLESLRRGANKIAIDENQSDEKRAEARDFIQGVSQIIKEIEGKNQKQLALIETIGRRLGDADTTVFFDVSEGIPL